MHQRQECAQENPEQDRRNHEVLEQIADPQRRGHGAEAVLLFNDEGLVQGKRDAQQETDQEENPEEHEARSDEVLLPGQDPGGQPWKEAAQQDRQRDQIVKKTLHGPEF